MQRPRPHRAGQEGPHVVLEVQSRAHHPQPNRLQRDAGMGSLIRRRWGARHQRQITEFYTYMKATRDLQRKLAAMKPPRADEPLSKRRRDMDPWHGAMSDLIYMMFLGYESGRKAIKDLIEFEPTRAERTIVMLLTELECYGFLIKEFREDSLRYPRLRMREKVYTSEVPALYRDVNKNRERRDVNRDWEPARLISKDLASLYNDIFPQHKISLRPAGHLT